MAKMISLDTIANSLAQLLKDFSAEISHSPEFELKDLAKTALADEKDFCEFRRLNADGKKRKADPAFVGALACTDDQRCRKQCTGQNKQRNAQLFQIPFIVERGENQHARYAEQNGCGLNDDVFDPKIVHRRMNGGCNDNEPHDRKHDGENHKRTVELTEMCTDGIRKCSCSFYGFAAHGGDSAPFLQGGSADESVV
jgi:hypothetical protein